MSFSCLDRQKNDFTNGEILWFVHDQTRCEVLHVHNNDLENAFVFAVPSMPRDNSGIPHILEHTVLGGSERFRLKSPFFHFEQGSCRTFLNASTYTDRTLYLGASTLKVDFFNLFSMYGDAVWFPLLKEETFHREGFMLIPLQDGNFTCSGVVYNEMKGEYSDKNTLILEKIQQSLYPDTDYRFDAGGCPDEIPFLSYEDFLGFHRKWYKPQHTKILLYGNIPTEEKLAFIEGEFLSRWHDEHKEEKIEFESQRPLQLNSEIHVDVPFAGENLDSLGTVDISWLLGKNDDPVEYQQAIFLHSVLVGIPGAPLRMRLLESGLADDISMLTGLSGHLYDLSYTLGMTGYSPEKNVEIKDFILSSLKEVIQEGFPKSFIEASLSRVEFRLREALIDTSGKISWLSRLARGMLYGKNPMVFSDINKIFTDFKATLKQPRSLERYAEEKLIDNMHRVISYAKPVQGYTERMQKEEQKRFHTLWSSFSEEKREHHKKMYDRVEKLSIQEDDPAELQSILRLQVDQLPKKIITWNEERDFHSDPPIYWVENTRNKLLYVSLHFDIDSILSDEYMRFLIPTFVAAFTDIGTKNKRYDVIATRIRDLTGRMSMNMENVTDLEGNMRALLTLEISFIERAAPEIMKLLQELFLELDFSRHARLQEIVTEGKSMFRNRMPDAGTMYAALKAASLYTENACLDDDWNGPKQYQWLMQKSDIDRFSSVLHEMRKQIFTRERMSATLVCTEGQRASITEALCSVYRNIPSVQRTPMTIKAERSEKGGGKYAFLYPAQVAFNAMVMPTVSYTDLRYAAFELAIKVISNKLLENIRLQRGAYSAGAQLLGAEGLLYLYTYRDPCVKESYQDYIAGIEETARGSFTEQALESLIVGTVGEAIKVFSPLKKLRIVQFRSLTKVDNALRQRIRDSLLGLRKKDIVEAAQQIVETIPRASFASVCNKDLAKQMEWTSVQELPQ